MEDDPNDSSNMILLLKATEIFEACSSSSDIDVRKIVLDYLVHNCFTETAEAFISCTELECSPDSFADVYTRKRIYNHVMEGDPLKAIECSLLISPDMFESRKDVLFDLLALYFVELVRANNCIGALEFAQTKLSDYGKMEKYNEKLENYMMLLTYEEPEMSPVFELLSINHRQNVADSLNQSILAYYKRPRYPSLERLLRQLILVVSCTNPDGEEDDPPTFSLSKFLRM